MGCYVVRGRWKCITLDTELRDREGRREVNMGEALDTAKMAQSSHALPQTHVAFEIMWD